MKRSLTAFGLCTLAGCASPEPPRSDEIAKNLSRIEARLDDLAKRLEQVDSTSTQAPAEAPPSVNPSKLAVLARRADLMAELQEHRSAGFTDAYPPIRQLEEEIVRLLKIASAMPDLPSREGASR
jgi:outer membrane murein-binding lipoprotein Lpp